MAVTIKEIADLANVSRATVDKVIHHRPGVKKETEERILTILKELNYQPNLIGKALVNSKNPFKLGIILTPEYNTYIQYTLKGIRRAEKEFSHFGIDVTVKMLTSLEPVELMSILNEFQAMHISGLAILPMDDAQVKAKINQIAGEGTAVVTFNSRLRGIDEICFIGQDHYKGGRIAAGLMEKIVPEEGDIGVIISTKNLSCHQDRLSGFTTRIAESKIPLSIVDIQENQDRKEDAFRITLEYCNKYPNLKGIYLAGGGITGVASALSLSNNKSRIKLICHDLLPESSTLLKNGIVDFVLGQSAEEQGYQLIKILFDFLVKEQTPKDQFYEIPVEIITGEMV